MSGVDKLYLKAVFEVDKQFQQDSGRFKGWVGCSLALETLFDVELSLKHLMIILQVKYT